MDGTPMYQVHQKVKSTRMALMEWRKPLKRNSEETIQKLTSKMEELRGEGDATEILKIRGLNPNGEDLWMCKFSVKGKFSVHADYVSLMKEKICITCMCMASQCVRLGFLTALFPIIPVE
ncbi:D-tyrosyl-tRNA(Tyr) deacylase, partial [Striga asiatica]